MEVGVEAGVEVEGEGGGMGGAQSKLVENPNSPLLTVQATAGVSRLTHHLSSLMQF